ncbi:MAG: Ppx/GppA family phosphatase [Alphaproteobacteria bacterium]|nr:Ppx/GppA family phosphatase [Alphaproteobacteria bacterium]
MGRLERTGRGDKSLADSDRPATDAGAVAAGVVVTIDGSLGDAVLPLAVGAGPNGYSGSRAKSENSQPVHRGRAPLYAALDLGTNNCRLLIARPVEGGFRVMDGFTRIVRLGEGVSQTGRLSEDAMQRTIEALRHCRAKIEHYAPRRARLIATEACRTAENSEDFLGRVRDEVGLDLEIVDRRTEAELAVTGCADLIDADATGALMFDIGGGSSELAWLDFRGGRPRKQGRMSAAIRSWQSLPVGVVTIAEKFGGVDVTPERFEEMVAYVSGLLTQFKGRDKLRSMIAKEPVHLIGTSGTVTTLAGLHLGLERYDRSKVDGLWMRGQDMIDTMRALTAMSYERRAAHPCIGRDRADLVIPGCAIFEAIRREWPTDRVRVADRGLREGMLISLMDADRAAERGRGRR